MSVTPERAMEMADMAMSQANIAMNNACQIRDKFEPEIKAAIGEAKFAVSGMNKLGDQHRQLSSLAADQQLKIKELEENNHDLNLSLSDTNTKIEVLEELYRDLKKMIKGESETIMEMAGDLVAAEEDVEGLKKELAEALTLLDEIRKTARSNGDMNGDEWGPIDLKLIAILDRHDLI